jgi:hypothetical protein
MRTSFLDRSSLWGGENATQLAQAESVCAKKVANVPEYLRENRSSNIAGLIKDLGRYPNTASFPCDPNGSLRQYIENKTGQRIGVILSRVEPVRRR